MLQACLLNGSRTRADHPALPDTSVGVTTGSWAAVGGDRLQAIRKWATLPDHAPVNLHEPVPPVLSHLPHCAKECDKTAWEMADEFSTTPLTPNPRDISNVANTIPTVVVVCTNCGRHPPRRQDDRADLARPASVAAGAV